MRKNAIEAARLRDQGLTPREIADRVGLSPSTVRSLLDDPRGMKERARKARNGGTCEVCGGLTDGSNGRAKAPKRCVKCRPLSEHGTTNRYSWGCRCNECRAAHRERMRGLQGKPPPSHGYSGYRNYGCRCDVCREAHAEEMRSPKQTEYRRQWEQSVFGTVPPKHGTRYIYVTYGCRCDACTAAATEHRRDQTARRKARQA